MDSISQLTLGAAVGYAVAGKKMGKKAFIWGAFAGTLPDLDFILSKPFNDNFLYLNLHRGFSHSLIFSVIGPAIIAYISQKIWPKINKLLLYKVFFWGILTHIILDCFTSWGTQVFWPIEERVSFNAIFIVDPLYTVPLLICLSLALFKAEHKKRQSLIITGLALSTSYLCLCLVAKAFMHHKFTSLYKEKNIAVQRFITRPTPFNIIMWTSNAETESGYYHASISFFDKTVQEELYFVKKNHKLNEDFHDKKSQELINYCKGYYRIEKTENGIIIRDLRYGFLGDPLLNGENYVFSYHLSKNNQEKVKLDITNPRPDNNKLLLKQLWTRMKGI